MMVQPRGFTGETVMAGSFALVWNAFVGVWTIGALGAGPLFAAFSTPFWVAGGATPNMFSFFKTI